MTSTCVPCAASASARERSLRSRRASADADLRAAVEIMRAGAADFIARPFTARKLRGVVRALKGPAGAETRLPKNQSFD